MFKYLGVRNWGKYQERIGKSGDARRPFIRDAVSKDSDPDYSQLSPTERYTLDGCRRLIGLHGQNLPNDPTWVCRALVVGGSHRGHVGVAVRSLIGRGLLLLTNHKDPFSQELNETKRNERNEQTSPISSKTSTQEHHDQNPSLSELVEGDIDTDDVEVPKSKAWEIED